MKFRDKHSKGEQTLSEKIVALNEEVIKGQLKELVRGRVEVTLNEPLEQKASRHDHDIVAPHHRAVMLLYLLFGYRFIRPFGPMPDLCKALPFGYRLTTERSFTNLDGIIVGIQMEQG